MKKWIRRGIWACLVFGVLVAVFWFVFADYLVKRGIEKAGSRIVGAKVELAEADLTLLPFGLELDRLQVTNPDEPMRNLFEIDRIRLAVEAGYLLQRKFVGEEMTLDGVRLDTPRKVSGQLTAEPPEKEKSERKKPGAFAIPKLSVSDVGAVLKKEKLQTLIEAEQFKKDIQAEQEKYKKLLETLPDKQKLEGYKDRLKNMKGGKSLGSVLGASSELKTLKKDIENDLNLLRQAKGDLEKKVGSYKNRLERLKDMPKKDLERLKKKYSLSAEGADNMTRLLFGPKYADWVTKGLSLYQKIKPYMEKSDQSTKEKADKPPARREDESIPDVLIRIARVSLLLDAGTISGDVKDIASDQVVHGRPITFVFSGQQLETIKKLDVEGTLDRTVSEQATDTITAHCKGYRLVNASISDNPDLPVTLKDALADVDLDINIKNQTIDSRLMSSLSAVSFETVDQENRDPLNAAIADALSDISTLRVEAELRGTLEENDIHITSDIDRVLGKAVKKAVQKQAKAFEQKLKQQIGEKTGGVLAGLDSNIDGFGSINKELDGRLNLGDGLLGNTSLF